MHRIDLHYVSKPKDRDESVEEETGEELDDAGAELFKVRNCSFKTRDISVMIIQVVATKQIKSDDCFVLEKVFRNLPLVSHDI